MRRLELDYVARPVWSNPVGLLLLACAVVLAAWAYFDYAGVSEKNAQLQSQLDRLERTQTRLNGHAKLDDAQVQQLQIETKRANEVVDQLALPWSQLFKTLEASSHGKVALLGIQPDAKKRVVTIEAEGRDMPSAVEYVNRLGREGSLTGVHIISHQVQEQDPDRPVRFTVQAVWRERAVGK
jgi:hypothetical protein